MSVSTEDRIYQTEAAIRIWKLELCSGLRFLKRDGRAGISSSAKWRPARKPGCNSFPRQYRAATLTLTTAVGEVTGERVAIEPQPQPTSNTCARTSHALYDRL